MPMVSKVKALEAIILPLVLVIGSKYISVFLVNLIFSLNWGFSFSASQIFSLPFLHYPSQKDLVLANSLSSFVMVLVLAVGFTFVLFRFQHYHEGYIEPKVASRLHAKKMERLIVSEVISHNQITVWFTLAWLIFLLTLLEFLAGSIVLFVLAVNFTIVCMLSVVVVSDMYKKGAARRKVKHK
jgi:hypothetical protein